MPAPDAAWWPLKPGNLPDSGYATLPDGRIFRVNWHDNSAANPPAPYRVYRRESTDPDDSRSERIAGCETMLEVRAFLLALAYPGGNDAST